MTECEEAEPELNELMRDYFVVFVLMCVLGGPGAGHWQSQCQPSIASLPQ